MSDEEDYDITKEQDNETSSDEEIVKSEDYLINRRRARTSPVWEYFTIVDNKASMAQCHICQNVLSFKATVTNLYTHLRRRHPRAYFAYQTIKTTVDSDKNRVTFRTRGKIDEAATTHLLTVDSSGTVKIHNLEVLARWFELVEADVSKCRICDAHMKNDQCVAHLKKHPTHYVNYRKLREKGVQVIKTEKLDAPAAAAVSEDITLPEDTAVRSDDIDDSNNLSFSVNLTSAWDYYEKIELDTAHCRLCSKQVSWGDDVTQLRKHLDEDHVGLELADEEVIINEDTTQPEEVIVGETIDYEPKRSKKRKLPPKNPKPSSSNLLKEHSYPERPVIVSDEAYEDQLERFGSYVTALMRCLPKEVAVKYQIQIIERLLKETMLH